LEGAQDREDGGESGELLTCGREALGRPHFGQRQRKPERPAARHSGERRGALRRRRLGRKAAVQQGTWGRLLPFYRGAEHETPAWRAPEGEAAAGCTNACRCRA
jgi:hypothetical protein